MYLLHAGGVLLQLLPGFRGGRIRRWEHIASVFMLTKNKRYNPDLPVKIKLIWKAYI
jgi:redox-regulated HSP33 family molecular chaperone